MPKWLLPWLLPIVIVMTMLLALVANTFVAGLVLILLGFVGVPFAYTSYRKTAAKEREEGRPGGPSWLA